MPESGRLQAAHKGPGLRHVDQLTAWRSLDPPPGEDTEAGRPDLVGGLGVALARAFKTRSEASGDQALAAVLPDFLSLVVALTSGGAPPDAAAATASLRRSPNFGKIDNHHGLVEARRYPSCARTGPIARASNYD
jgi:hypothetical protein